MWKNHLRITLVIDVASWPSTGRSAQQTGTRKSTSRHQFLSDRPLQSSKLVQRAYTCCGFCSLSMKTADYREVSQSSARKTRREPMPDNQINEVTCDLLNSFRHTIHTFLTHIVP